MRFKFDLTFRLADRHSGGIVAERWDVVRGINFLRAYIITPSFKRGKWVLIQKGKEKN